jgi:hypothetical protein
MGYSSVINKHGHRTKGRQGMAGLQSLSCDLTISGEALEEEQEVPTTTTYHCGPQSQPLK